MTCLPKFQVVGRRALITLADSSPSQMCVAAAMRLLASACVAGSVDSLDYSCIMNWHKIKVPFLGCVAYKTGGRPGI